MNEVYKKSLFHSIATIIYIALVASIMENADNLFGKINGYLAPIAFLSLFTLSALIVGSLVLVKPIMFYLDGKKKEAVLMLSSTIGWLALFTIIILLILVII